MERYRTVEEVPEWAQETVRYLLGRQYLRREEDGVLVLDESMLRTLVVNDRAGLYD